MILSNSFSLLGISSDTIITILSVLLGIGAVYLAIKVPDMRKFIVTFVIIVIYIFGIYATIYNVDYMTIKGVTLGDITDSIISSTTVNGTNDNVWEFDSLGFVATDTEFKHSAIVKELTPAPNVDLVNKKYDIYVNNNRCQINESGNNYIKSSFMYEFYNADNELITTETLEIRFYIYNNYTELEIFTENGSVGVQYWKSFLVKNGFMLSIKESTFNNNDLVVDSVGNLEDYENFNNGVVNASVTFDKDIIDEKTLIVRLIGIYETSVYTRTLTCGGNIMFTDLPIDTYLLSFVNPSDCTAYVIIDDSFHTRFTFDITDIYNEYNFEIVLRASSSPIPV